MGKLAVTRLSDDRLQLFVTYPKVLSTWQISLDPAAAWTPLRKFDPDPGEAATVSAGHSPDGRA